MFHSNPINSTTISSKRVFKHSSPSPYTGKATLPPYDTVICFSHLSKRTIPFTPKNALLCLPPYQETRVSCLIANFPYSLLYQPIKVSPLPPPYKMNSITIGKARVKFFHDRNFLIQQPLPPPWQGGSSLLCLLVLPAQAWFRIFPSWFVGSRPCVARSLWLYCLAA